MIWKAVFLFSDSALLGKEHGKQLSAEHLCKKKIFCHNPIKPKKESDIGKLQEEYFQQSSEEEDPVIIETPKPVAVETDVVKEDESKFEEVAPLATPEEYPEIATSEDSQEAEVVEMPQDNSPSVSAPPVEQTPVETPPAEPVQFDETFQ